MSFFVMFLFFMEYWIWLRHDQCIAMNIITLQPVISRFELDIVML